MYKDEIVAEVRKNREQLLDDHGGIDAYLNHVKEVQSNKTRMPYSDSSPYDGHPCPPTSRETSTSLNQLVNA